VHLQGTFNAHSGNVQCTFPRGVTALEAVVNREILKRKRKEKTIHQGPHI
jgi:hypothetical protein